VLSLMARVQHRNRRLCRLRGTRGRKAQ
jgi:hypothetical protein